MQDLAQVTDPNSNHAFLYPGRHKDLYYIARLQFDATTTMLENQVRRSPERKLNAEIANLLRIRFRDTSHAMLLTQTEEARVQQIKRELHEKLALVNQAEKGGFEL